MIYSDWMGGILDGDQKLCTVVLPATHDSGMSSDMLMVTAVINPLSWAAHGASGVLAGIDDLTSEGRNHQLAHNNFVTQTHNVAGQLACGARQFDLRITRHNFTYRAYHGEAIQTVVGMRRYGEKWADICASIATFMQNYGKTEFLILKLDKQDDSSIDATMITMLSKALTGYNFDSNRPHLNEPYVDQEKIENLRGRVLVCSKRKTLEKWRTLGLHSSITLCEWQKYDKEGKIPKDKQKRGMLTFPIYALLGGAEGTHKDARTNILDKQLTMKNLFLTIPRGVGMRGIWFNTFSYLRDIKVYSGQIWDKDNLKKRDALWLDGAARQNVASVDFFNEAKAKYIIEKNAG